MELIAHRAWGLVRREGVWLLQSVASTQQVWTGPAVKSDHVPSKYGSEGIHAFKHQILVDFDYETLPVYGTIQLYGHIVEHKFGYRAEKAVIRSLQLNTKFNHSRILWSAVKEQMVTIKRLRGEMQVTKFVAVGCNWNLHDINEAKLALEKRYQLDVSINLEEDDG